MPRPAAALLRVSRLDLCRDRTLGRGQLVAVEQDHAAEPARRERLLTHGASLSFDLRKPRP
jgi:hypothetical protein